MSLKVIICTSFVPVFYNAELMYHLFAITCGMLPFHKKKIFFYIFFFYVASEGQIQTFQ